MSDASRPSFEQRKANFLTRLKDEKASGEAPGENARRGERRRSFSRWISLCCYSKLKVGHHCRHSTHIFSGATQNDQEYTAGALDLLKMSGMDSLAEKLLGPQVMFNVMTLHPSLLWDWEDLMFWFEPVPGQEHTYKLIPRDPDSWLRSEPPRPQQITFRVDPRAAQYCEDNQMDPKEIELPHPTLLALRAACTRVANMSGMVFVQ
ncbi:hypothetical protein R3P38DRAFT_460402 [Favolaschia claudopus]|uniref:Uncharacterized protein n=1 Tax=Favolaschia claudopus TaxID=2862362 RepID=A0AAV9ZEZ8_9AGAR